MKSMFLLQQQDKEYLGSPLITIMLQENTKWRCELMKPQAL